MLNCPSIPYLQRGKSVITPRPARTAGPHSPSSPRKIDHMAGGALGISASGNDVGRDAKVVLSVPVIMTCILAASGGLIFGYDIGISGGVTTMKSFLEKFFPGVLRRMVEAKTSQYCIYNSQVLTSFTSSLYLAGLASALLAGRITHAIGRRGIMLLGGVAFLAGAALNAFALNIEMLLLGRVLLGCGVGFTNQATPLYLSEVAPARWRGALIAAFSFFLDTGVLIANLINYAGARAFPSWAWRFSLGLAAAPAAFLLIGTLLIPESPSSLVARGHIPRARAALRRLRGPNSDVDPELDDLVKAAARPTEGDGGPFRRIFGRRYRHHLVMAVMLPLFLQLTGVNVVAFYSPVLFGAVGFGDNAALLAAVVLGAVNLGSIGVSMVVVDRFGRKVLFYAGGIQMFICQVAIACILGTEPAQMERSYSLAVLVFTCVYTAGFGWSWAPLIWVVPGEIFPSEVRSAGQSISVAVNFLVTFILAQSFLAMLCSFKYGVFAFYAGWIAVMTIFVAVLLPETKGVPLEDMEGVWEKHWFWRRYCIRREETK